MLPAPEAVRMKVEKRVKRVKGCIMWRLLQEEETRNGNGRMKKKCVEAGIVS